MNNRRAYPRQTEPQDPTSEPVLADAVVTELPDLRN